MEKRQSSPARRRTLAETAVDVGGCPVVPRPAVQARLQKSFGGVRFDCCLAAAGAMPEGSTARFWLRPYRCSPQLSAAFPLASAGGAALQRRPGGANAPGAAKSGPGKPVPGDAPQNRRKLWGRPAGKSADLSQNGGVNAAVLACRPSRPGACSTGLSPKPICAHNRKNFPPDAPGGKFFLLCCRDVEHPGAAVLEKRGRGEAQPRICRRHSSRCLRYLKLSRILRSTSGPKNSRKLTSEAMMTARVCQVPKTS